MPSAAEIRANLLAWITDLETTDAKQGQAHLRTTDNAYCCLGRLCELEKVEWQLSWDKTDYSFSYDREPDEDHDEFGLMEDNELTGDLRRKYGITEDEETTLVQMNDGTGPHLGSPKTFPEIAAWLRANVLPRYPETAAV